MSFLKKLFNKTGNTSTETAKPVNFLPAKSKEELLQQFGAIGLEKQSYVPEVIGNNQWNVDMGQGTISFGANLHVPIQVLGTISHSSQTWLWAWANDKSGIPAELLVQANELKKYGEENGIEFLEKAQFGADINDLHMIGCIASGMFGSNSYYIADYGKGAMLALLKAKEFETVQKHEHLRILTTFPQFISTFDCNHKKALINYLTLKGYTLAIGENEVSAQKANNSIAATFDNLDRLVNIKG